jgi:DNA methyltransferase 1-associated protein 1
LHVDFVNTQVFLQMGDVAQILKDTKIDDESPSKAMTMTGIPKDVMQLLGGKQDPISAALPPIVPTFTSNEIKVKVGNKTISSSKPARQWTWAPFCSSSRNDGALFSHWVRANVEYTDYPYAKFDIHLDPVTYTDEDYESLLKNDGWTKSETDKLLDLCRIFELRWPVIHDRWLEFYDSVQGSIAPLRKVEDLQERYYSVAAALAQARIRHEAAAEVQALTSVQHDHSAPNAAGKVDQNLLETAAARALATAAPTAQPLMTDLGTGSTNKTFDAASERERRAQIDRMWRRSKKEEQEEMELRKELREIETQLRKLKKLGGHVLAAAGNRMSSGANSRHASRSATPVPGSAIVDNPVFLDESFASTAPQPMPQNPYLQSGRLMPPAAGGSSGVNKTLLTRMQQVMAELKVPGRPLPTKRVCDLYDSVRKDILTLVTLQKMVLQKEGTLHSKRVKLSKLGAGDGKVLDEEELLGIAPPPPPPAPVPASGAKKTTKSSTPSVKAKTASGTKVKASDKSSAGDDAKSGEKVKTVKRKRKVDGKDPPAKKAAVTGEAAAKAPQKPATIPSAKAPVTAATATASVTPKTPKPVTNVIPGASSQDSSVKKRARKS